MADFEIAVAVLLAQEGGHAVDPNDPGGDTWYGIARRDHPAEPWPPTVERAKDIYRTDYWALIRGDELPDQGVATMLLDSAANQGAVTAVRILQRALAARGFIVTVDGVFGPITLGQVRSGSPEALLDELLAQRALAYMTVADFPRFASTWFRRLAAVHRAGVTAQIAP